MKVYIENNIFKEMMGDYLNQYCYDPAIYIK